MNGHTHPGHGPNCRCPKPKPEAAIPTDAEAPRELLELRLARAEHAMCEVRLVRDALRDKGSPDTNGTFAAGVWRAANMLTEAFELAEKWMPPKP